MDLCYAGKQEYKCYIVWRAPWGHPRRGDSRKAECFLFCCEAWSWMISFGGSTVGFADDIAILINGKFSHTVSEVLQTALHTVQQWCERKKSINPNKMVIIPFTRKRNTKGLKTPILFNK
jgi:hypothetical protein